MNVLINVIFSIGLLTCIVTIIGVLYYLWHSIIAKALKQSANCFCKDCVLYKTENCKHNSFGDYFFCKSARIDKKRVNENKWRRIIR